jgi:hypothetical protein
MTGPVVHVTRTSSGLPILWCDRCGTVAPVWADTVPEDHAECEPAPWPYVHIYRARFTGAPVARCTGCDTVSAYWEDPEELAHMCTVECDRCAGTVTVWSEPRLTKD